MRKLFTRCFVISLMSVLVISSSVLASQEQKLLADDGDDGDRLGSAVAIEGNYLVCGAPEDDAAANRSGSAYVFKWETDSWVQHSKIVPADAQSGAQFGNAVAMAGNYLLIGAFRDKEHGNQAGAAYLWERFGDTWSFQTKLTPNTPQANSEFGYSVAINGDYAVIGAHRYEHSGENIGAAYVFERNGMSWVQDAMLLETGLTPSSSYGCAVGVNGNTIMVGAKDDATTGISTGAVYIYDHDGVNWNFLQRMVHPNGNDNDHFGCSLAIDTGGWAIVGADAGNGSAVDSGLAYICNYHNGTWGPFIKHVPIPSEPDVGFGWSVAMKGGSAAVGAPWTNAEGVTLSGKVHTYNYDGSTWQYGATFTASDPTFNGHLGYSVAVQNNEGVFGAIGAENNGDYTGAGYWNFDFSKPNPTATPTPVSITYDIHMIDDNLKEGDTFSLRRACYNPISTRDVDEWIILDVFDSYWYWPGWDVNPVSFTWSLPFGVDYDDVILEFDWPLVEGDVTGLRFWGAFLEAGTVDLIEYDMVEWGYSNK